MSTPHKTNNGDMHLAITARMSEENPSDDQRLELRLAWEEAGKFLEGSMPLAQTMNTNDKAELRP
jgi:hypothetical protein